MKSILVSFETLKKPKNVDVFVPAWSLGEKKWQSEVMSHLRSDSSQRLSIIPMSFYRIVLIEKRHSPHIRHTQPTFSASQPPGLPLFIHYAHNIPPRNLPHGHSYSYLQHPFKSLRSLPANTPPLPCHHDIHHPLPSPRARPQASAGMEPDRARFWAERRCRGCGGWCRG